MLGKQHVNVIVDRTRGKNATLLIVLFLVLQICFTQVVKDLYVFQKVSLSVGLIFEFKIFRFLLATFLILAWIVLITLVRTKGFLYMILVLILVFFVFPSGILYSNTVSIDSRIFLSHNLFFLTTLGLGKIRLKIPSKTIDLYSSRKLLLNTVLIGIIPFLILYLPHINLKNLLLKEVYETRAFMSASVNNFYTAYTYSWFNKILIPTLIVFGIYFKDRKTVLFSAFTLIFLYLCGAHKAVFVGLLMVLILYRFDYWKKATYFISFIVFLALFSLFLSQTFNNDFLMVMTVRRAIFLPNLLDILYFNFFDGNHLYWSETFDGLFINYPYELSHSYIVGEAFFNDIKWGANNGIISDGFMNYGLIGVFINILIVSFYFSILNQLNISSRFFGVFFLLFFVLISSSLPTVMLTHGGFLLILVSFIFLKDTAFKMEQ
ncbi:hypothetical protein [Flagellimonas marinaquae]|uniref:hypothetical protein n=1 Tax=Flagellimonas marinaquae TaxID=254955 RepID=UPI00207562F1|nr:hypothetical protein [Allomuricauda aquimarina]USD26666.1 hypothetical protein MJO53_07155 [Allomuricauda aquimarina]